MVPYSQGETSTYYFFSYVMSVVIANEGFGFINIYKVTRNNSKLILSTNFQK